MTLLGSQRRGLRRRLLQSGSGTDQTPGRSAEQAAGCSRPDRTTPYSREARPENHPALGTWLPTRPLPLAGAVLAIVVPIAGLIAASATLERLLPVGADAGGRGGAWAATCEQVRACLSMAPRTGLAAWMGQLALVAASCVAISVRRMRRHRLDDYQGRYRAWGWIAGLALVATIERQMPLAPLVSTLLADATGIAPGPNATGWWLCLSVPLCLAVGLWAVLPMRERVSTASALAAAGGAWIGGAACSWAAASGPTRTLELASGGLSLAGDGLLLVAMLIAARSVLVEVRGEVQSTPAKAPRPAVTHKPPCPQEAPRPRLARDEASEDDSRNDDASRESTHWSDGSEGAEDDSDEAWDGGGRKLSKAERKRLRKMARMNRAA